MSNSLLSINEGVNKKNGSVGLKPIARKETISLTRLQNGHLIAETWHYAKRFLMHPFDCWGGDSSRYTLGERVETTDNIPTSWCLVYVQHTFLSTTSTCSLCERQLHVKEWLLTCRFRIFFPSADHRKYSTNIFPPHLTCRRAVEMVSTYGIVNRA